MQDYTAGISRLPGVESAADARRALVSAVVTLFALTMFLGSGLLFLVQPMFAKLILPLLGGSPSVWNTCVLFFQTMLLVGYLYAHLSTRWLSTRSQLVCHLLLLLAPLVALPLGIGGAEPPVSETPLWWLLRTLAITVGLPFFVVATTAPVLQRWFAALPLPSARDPYFLYAASNVGSLIALVGYPLVVEPLAGTRDQTWLWSGGYLLLVVLIALCAMSVSVLTGAARQSHEAEETLDGCGTCAAGDRLWWVVLSFVPSSLMLGVTTHIATDIAAVPMLWVGPLALYLLTFVLAFSRRQIVPHRWIVRALPALILGSLVTVVLNARLASLIALHVVAFFAVAMVCHRELADRRPAPRHLTEFYLWLSFGGMLGGVFNTLLAPQIFTGVLEYPLVLAVAAIVRPSPGYRQSRFEPWLLLTGLPAVVLIACLGTWGIGAFPADLGVRPILLTFATLLTAAFIAANRTQPFGVMALVFVGVIAFGRPSGSGTVLFAGRSFFGVHRVLDAPDHTYHLLQHGSTTHGRQQTSVGQECSGTGYYHPSSPIGQLFTARKDGFGTVAVVGLGTGALACYARADSSWTYYEIDPLVEQIARDPRYFTYLRNTKARLSVVLGDARISLGRTAARYDLVVLDAFSSDAIPIHLLTREAIRLYLSHLRPDGVIAIHISNRYLKLEPILAALTTGDGLYAVGNADDRLTDEQAKAGKFASHWIMVARDREPLTGLLRNPGWRILQANASGRAWTDDYSNILQAIRR